MTSVAFVLACVCSPAQATFPGQNGKIAFSRSFDVWSMNSDGSGETNLTDTPSVHEFGPTWSADGTKIAFDGGGDLFVMSATGADATNVTNTPEVIETAPVWSPDGTKLAYTEGDGLGTTFGTLSTMELDGSNRIALAMTRVDYSTSDKTAKSWSPDGTKIAFRSGAHQISLISADGTGEHLIADRAQHPSWSPDGTRIAFDRFAEEIYVMDADGTDETPLTTNTAVDHSPAWSPDGARIAFTSTRTGSAQTFTMNTDGTDQTQVTTMSSISNDWQPIPVNAYARPKGATPFWTYLVPAYQSCTAPNRTHGPPLAFGSCGPPTSASSLTIGTPDANAKPAKSVSVVRYSTLAGNPATPADEADVTIDATITDVYERATLADYSGNLSVTTPLRITDKLNTPHPGGPGAGTVSDTALGFDVPCATTPDTTVGASCAFSTSYDALVPGVVTEGRRSIWALGQVELRDSGGAPFLRQGIFVP